MICDSPRGKIASMDRKLFPLRLRYILFCQAVLLAVSVICFLQYWGYASLAAYASAIGVGAFAMLGRPATVAALIGFAVIWLILTGGLLLAMLMSAAA